MSQQTTVAVGSLDLRESVLDGSDISKPLSESPLNTDRDSIKNTEQLNPINTPLGELLSESSARRDGKFSSISNETTLTIGELPCEPTAEPDSGEDLISLHRSEKISVVSESLIPSNSSFRSEPPKELLSEQTQENNDLPRTSIEPSSEPQSSPPNQPPLVDIIQNTEGKQNLISELPKTDSELPKANELSLQRESSGVSEPLNQLLTSSLTTEGNKYSQVVPLQLTGAALARRLNVSASTLRHKKNARNFGKWTSGHDPDGIAWYFDGQQFISKTSSHIQ